MQLKSDLQHVLRFCCSPACIVTFRLFRYEFQLNKYLKNNRLSRSIMPHIRLLEQLYCIIIKFICSYWVYLCNSDYQSIDYQRFCSYWRHHVWSPLFWLLPLSGLLLLRASIGGGGTLNILWCAAGGRYFSSFSSSISRFMAVFW